MGVAAPGLRLKTPGKTTVTVNIRPVDVQRAVHGVRVRLRNLSQGLAARLTPATVVIEIKGPRGIVESATPEALNAFVDLAGLEPGRYNLEVHVEQLQRIEILRVEPATVVARIR